MFPTFVIPNLIRDPSNPRRKNGSRIKSGMTMVRYNQQERN